MEIERFSRPRTTEYGSHEGFVRRGPNLKLILVVVDSFLKIILYVFRFLPFDSAASWCVRHWVLFACEAKIDRPVDDKDRVTK